MRLKKGRRNGSIAVVISGALGIVTSANVFGHVVFLSYYNRKKYVGMPIAFVIAFGAGAVPSERPEKRICAD